MLGSLRHDRVVCISLNPALDRVAVIDELPSSTTVRADSAIDTAGGKAVHVARVAAALGVRVDLVVTLGGERGAHVAGLLDADPLTPHVVDVAGETRMTYTVVHSAHGPVIEVLEPAATLQDDALAAIDALVDSLCGPDALTVIAGSLPGMTSPGAYRALVERAKGRGSSVILDSSGAALAAGLQAGPDLIAPNRLEAVALVEGAADDADPATLLQGLRRLGSGSVWLSDAARGSWLQADGRTYRLEPAAAGGPFTVGCGDALLGGMAAGLTRGDDLVSSAMLGVACAADKLRHVDSGRIDPVGAMGWLERIDVDELLENEDARSML